MKKLQDTKSKKDSYHEKRLKISTEKQKIARHRQFDERRRLSPVLNKIEKTKDVLPKNEIIINTLTGLLFQLKAKIPPAQVVMASK